MNFIEHLLSKVDERTYFTGLGIVCAAGVLIPYATACYALCRYVARLRAQANELAGGDRRRRSLVRIAVPGFGLLGGALLFWISCTFSDRRLPMQEVWFNAVVGFIWGSFVGAAVETLGYIHPRRPPLLICMFAGVILCGLLVTVENLARPENDNIPATLAFGTVAGCIYGAMAGAAFNCIRFAWRKLASLIFRKIPSKPTNAAK